MKNISLIANSGIQFYSFKVNLGLKTSAMKISGDFFEKEEIDSEGNKEYTFVFPHYLEKKQYFIELSDEITSMAMNYETGDIDEEKIPAHLIQKIPEHKIITVRARETLQLFENTWLPMPFLRKSYDGKKFQQGPETWAMFWYSRIPGTNENSKFTHNAVLAIDTKCEDNEQAYLTPTENDAKNSVFECATHWKDNSFFFAREWVQEWLKGDFDKKMKEMGKPTDEYFFMHTSYYLTLLKVFERAECLPKITLHTNDISIDVDLVLDIGNSRTTGILIESAKEGQSFEFTDAIPLELRDITYPDRTYSDPFEMRMAFVKSTLGNEAAFTLSGNPKAFAWPSLIRIGPEARRLSVLNTAENSNSIMSSPKRYLWDTDKRVFPWTYISKEQDHFAKPALFGLAELYTEDGTYIERQRKLFEDDPDMHKRPIPAINPYFSRSSLMSFAMAEIFLQGITFVNSYEFRKRQGQEFLPRKLKRIILTCPTAMLQTEQAMLRKHAIDAVDALKQYFGDSFIDDNLTIIPDAADVSRAPDKRTEWNFDEATSNQLAYIYGEITDKFLNNANLYIETVGKKRLDSKFPERPAVTIASVDIGGGTTDLMITSYQANPKANITVLTPDPKFWEGFNFAGDDIVKRVIERIVLPNIKEASEKKGAQNIINTMNFLFGPFLGKTTSFDKLMKKQFANQIAIPLAFEILQHSAEERPTEVRTFDSLFINYPRPNKQLLNYLNKEIQKSGATEFNIENVIWELNGKRTNKVVKDVVEKMIRDMAGIIAQYDCDFVLLSGRPSTLPIIKDLFLKFLPVTPDRLVQLGNYRIGTWYPFATETGVIKDPKTSVVVGATVALMAGTLRRLEDFTIDTSLLKEKFGSTADYIGEYDTLKAKLKSVFLDPDTDNRKIEFFGHMLLGRRQMRSDEWIAAPMYKLSYSTLDAAKNLKDREPLIFDLERDPRNKERIRPLRNLMDNEGKKVPAELLSLKMQTLADENGYWMDTGIFLIQLFD